MKRPPPNLWRFLLVGAGIAYPFLVYALLGRVPAWIFLALVLCLAAGRGLALRPRIDRRLGAVAVLVAAALLILFFLKNTMGAVRLYPALMSLTMAGAFGFSLVRPPTLIEHFARLAHPNLPPAGVRYARKVTWVWFAFLVGNTAIAVWTVFCGTLAQWTLWNGLIAYLAMGILFVGEYLVRKAILR